MPKSFVAQCNAQASQFASPKHLEAKKEEKKERVATAVLSTTARAKAREKKKEREEGKGGDAMEETKKEEDATDKMDTEEEKTADESDKKGDDEKAKSKEPATHSLENPARLTLAQQAFVEIDADQRYVPVQQVWHPPPPSTWPQRRRATIATAHQCAIAGF